MEVIVDKLDNRWNQDRKKISYKEISNFHKKQMIELMEKLRTFKEWKI